MADVAEGISQANGVSFEFDYRRNYPATINTREESDLAYGAAVKVAGADTVLQDWPPEMGAEDFSFFLRHVPGCYLFIGNGTEGHSSYSLHNPRYDFNDQVLSAGASFWVQLVEDLLSKSE